MKILSTYNIKGGVGKTAAAINLAYLAAHSGARTLVWDLDPQGATSFYFRIRPRIKGGSKSLLTRKRPIDRAIKGTDFRNLDLLPADFSYRNLDLDLADTKKPVKQLRKLLDPLEQDYDIIFMDCPPSISLVSENVFNASNALLVPMIPTTLSLRTYEQLASHLEKEHLSHMIVLPFFSMVDRRKRLHSETVEALQADDARILKTDIPYSSQIELMGTHRAPVCHYEPKGKAALAYTSLWQEINNIIWNKDR